MSRLLWASLLLVACGGDDGEATTTPPPGTETTPLDSTALDTGSLTDTGTVDPCAEVPITTWDNFGAGFITQNCQACHATDAPDRYGAPVEVVFDTEDDALAWAPRILSRVVDLADMPPQGGLTADDRELVTYWLQCSDR